MSAKQLSNFQEMKNSTSQKITRLIQFQWRKRILGIATEPAVQTNKPKPETQVAVIGDTHGRADLLAVLLNKIETKFPDAHQVFVGDYVDRGPDSASVLDTLSGLGPKSTCLMGNHEIMLLEFLDQPAELGGRWLRNGGFETLASFGVRLSEQPSVEQIVGASESFRASMPSGIQDWIRRRPLWWRSGNLLVTHAGPDPALPIEQQSDTAFLWGHNRFLRDARIDDLWVAHGHWVMDKPVCANGRISVDTGAYFTGRLTAAIVSTDGSVKFVTT